MVMNYGNFSLKNFENIDWQDLQAERTCRESQLVSGGPIQKARLNLIGSNALGAQVRAFFAQ